MLLLLLSCTAGVSSLFNYYLLTIKETGRQWIVMLMANAVTWVVGYQLIPQRPISGALLALMAGAVCQLLSYLLMSYRPLMGKKEQAL